MRCFVFDSFSRYDEPGKSPQKHGKPPRTRSGERDSDGIVLTNLRKCVKDIWLVPDIEWHSTVMELRKMYRMKSKQKVVAIWISSYICINHSCIYICDPSSRM